ncbi:TonB family protein [Ruegeria sp.]|uniref:TonB family protein n=1 Tax=Ruegeria sp. TaxID=1879320 RepID=UPI003C7A4E1A
MIPNSRAVAVSVIILAAATHSLALHELEPEKTAQIEGSGVVRAAALGSSFKDFSAGTTASAPEREPQNAVQPDQITRKVDPQRHKPMVAKPMLTQTTAAAQILRPPEAASSSTAVTEPVTPPVRQPEPEEKKAAQTSAKAGNSNRNQKKGSVTGEDAKGAETAKEANRTAASQGNADADNYAGKIKRKILRARRKSVNIKGSVIVSFRIADSGALLSASIARSSGSQRLDQVALAQVRAAAPFPAPPASVRREYSMEIVSK